MRDILVLANQNEGELITMVLLLLQDYVRQSPTCNPKDRKMTIQFDK